MARSWYIYDGMGSPFLGSSYNIAFIKPVCLHGCKVCAIYASGTGNNPVSLSNNIRGYIINMMASSVAQPIEGGAKIYLYGRKC